MRVYLFCVLLFATYSCSDSYIEYDAGTLFLNDQQQEYLDFYRDNSKLTFVELKSQSKSREERKEWQFDRMTIEPESSFGSSTAIKFGSSGTKGEEERLEYFYKDEHNQTIRISLEAAGSVSWNSAEWQSKTSIFKVSFNIPCFATYLSFNPERFDEGRSSSKYNTIIQDTMQIGDKIYKEVMVLETPKEDSHFKFFATKYDGIVKIENVDLDETWVLPEAVSNVSTIQKVLSSSTE